MDRSLEKAIRERAYEAWLASGCVDGLAEAHWLDAERALRVDTPVNSVTPAAAPGTTVKAAAGATIKKSKRAAATPVASITVAATKPGRAGTSLIKAAAPAKPRSRSARGAVAVQAGA